MVFCQKMKQELQALDRAPYPGELGNKIFENISNQAWQMWVQHQTMLINEYRLNLMDPEAREFLTNEMQKFLFEDSAEKPEGYTPPDK